MKSQSIGVVVVLAGVAAHLFLLLFLLDSQPDPSEVHSKETKFSFGSPASQSSHRNQTAFADLFDSQSLFMPTQYNSASSFTEVSGLQEASEVFSDFPPSLALGALPLLPPDPQREFTEDEKLLPSGPAFISSVLFRDLAISSPEVKAKPEGLRGSALPIIAGEALELSSLIDLENAPTIDFESGPMEAILHIEQGRPVGQPVIWRDSINSEKRSLMKSFLWNPETYLNLSDGYYKLTVYPQ